MNGDTEDTPATPAVAPPTTANTASSTPVRRSARTRKPNSRFADDEVGGCFKKIVSGIVSPEAAPPAPVPAPTPGRPRKATGRRKDRGSEDKSDEGEDRSERCERGRKDSKEEEEEEERSERGRKLSEEVEEKSEKKREEEMTEERREEGRKGSQNEQVEEKDERRKENRSDEVEEKQERRRKVSETEEKEKRKRKDSQCEERREEKTPTHALHNGLEGTEEFVRVTRSGRREEDPRRKPVRKRGKGKEDERDESETAPEDLKSKDSPAGKSSQPATQEGSRVTLGAPQTPQNRSDKTDSDVCVKISESGAPRVQTSVHVGAGKGSEPLSTPLKKDRGEEGTHTPPKDMRFRSVMGQVMTVTLTRLSRTNTTSSSTTTPTTTSTTTTTALTTTATTTTKTTTITTTATTTSHPPPKLIPPQAPAEPLPDPRLNRGTRSNLGAHVGGLPPPKPPSSTTPAIKMKEGVVVALGSRVNPRECQRVPDKVKSVKLMENIPLPSVSPSSVPAASPSSPTLSRQEEEALRKAGGKRERVEKEENEEEAVRKGGGKRERNEEESAVKVPKPKEEKEAEVTSPHTKRRKEEDGGRKEENVTKNPKPEEKEVKIMSPLTKRRKEEETREETKQEEMKRRLGDMKEDDQRKRRKVEDVEEREPPPATPTSPQKETPTHPTLSDVNIPPESPRAPAPAAPTPVPPPKKPPATPSPKKTPVMPQNSPRGKKEAVMSPRIERESPREKEPPISVNPAPASDKELPREKKDSKGEKEPLKDNTNSLRSVEGEKCEEVCESKSVCERDAKEESAKEEKECVRGKEEVSKGERETVKSKECGKSENKDQIKTEMREKTNEKETSKGRMETVRGEKECVRGKEEVSKGERDAMKSKECGKSENKDQTKIEKGKEEESKGEKEPVKSKDFSKSENKDQPKTETREKASEKETIKGRTEAAKGDKECVRGKEEVSKGEKEPMKSKDCGKSENKDQAKTETREKVGEREASKGRMEAAKECVKGKEEVNKGEKEATKSKECGKSENKDQGKTEMREKASEKEASKGRTETGMGDKETARNKSERETNKNGKEQTKKDATKSDKTEKDDTNQGDKDRNKARKDGGKDEKESGVKRTQITNLLDIPMPSDAPPATTTTTTTATTDAINTPGLFSQNSEDQGGLGSFLGFSSSSTAIPFLEDTASPASECEIPGLSIIASSSPKPSVPKKKDDQSHRSWFAFRGGRRSQTNGQTDTQKDESNKENKKEEEEEEKKKKEEEEKKKKEEEEEVQGIQTEEIMKEEPMDLEEEEEEEKEEEKKEIKKEEEEEKKEEKTEVEETKKEEVKVEEEKEVVEVVDEEQQRKEAEEKEARNKAVVEERLRSFTHVEENVYIGERKRSKRNKEVRRMVCDCSLTKEEIARGEEGCGEDCLNRLLMIECGSRCPLADRCTNKRFLNRQYGDVEVFNADEKGCGLRARSDLPPGTFIMEYVGEVFDTREFKRRRKEYARDMRAHFYFMALKSDQLIDATRMGNISRFINHSCDPNAETQKWTVNGDLRIGFFSKKHIEAGEEINFDYRLERYGREPQRCYCGTAICRGWLGESPDEQTKEEKDEARRKEERDRRKREERRAYFEDIDLEDEIEKLNSHKLRNRQDTLNLSRLMVRAEDFSSRVMLLQLLQTGEPACRRLFLDYHGLKVLWSWMADLGLSRQHTALKVEILKTLEVLPITNKTQLTDSRVLSLVERWSGQGEYTRSSTSSTSLSPPPPPPPPPKTTETALPPSAPALPAATPAEPDTSNKKSSDTSEESDSETEPKPPIEGSSADDSSMDSEVDNPKTGTEEESSDSNDAKDTAAALIPGADGKLRAEGLSDEEKEVLELLELHKSMVELAKKLLDAWKNLKEFFRIPKKERIELMKEHEREVDRGYKEYLDQASESDRDSERDRDRRDKDRYNRRDHHYDRRRRSPDREKDRYPRGRGQPREDRSSDSPKMSKEQRRQLFELKVQQQEEEAKQRKMQEEMWTMHVDRCRLLGHDPYLTPIFDPTYQYFWDPVAANWQPYTGSDPNLPVPAAYGLNKGEGDGSPMTLVMAGAQGCRLGGAGELPGLGQGGPDDPLNPANIPLPGEVPMLPPGSPSQGADGTPPHAAKLLSIPLPGEAATAGLEGVPGLGGEGTEVPSAITVHLPPRWRVARDADGHVYFYHVKTRITQWDPPTILTPGLASDSSSSSSSSSDEDSSSSTDSEDFSSEEEEEEEAVEEVETVERSEVSNEKMIRHPKNSKRRRSEALVQERVISPILEVDKEAARRERREAKERAREEARQERQEERNIRTQKEEPPQPQIEQQQQQQQQQQQMEGVEEVAAVIVPTERERERERDRERERERRAERHEARAKREKVKSKERAATAIADNSDTARKIKDTFRSKMATFIVSVLNPYRRGDCREGKITCTEDFKYLARKLTHFVMVKELKQLHSIEALECSDSVKHKTRDFVRKYMSKYGSVFKRDPNDTKEY